LSKNSSLQDNPFELFSPLVRRAKKLDPKSLISFFLFSLSLFLPETIWTGNAYEEEEEVLKQMTVPIWTGNHIFTQSSRGPVNYATFMSSFTRYYFLRPAKSAQPICLALPVQTRQTTI